MSGKLRHDSYCGLNCGACPVGRANEEGNEDALRIMAEEWNADREALDCSGCKTDETAGYCTDCTMRACAREKGLEFCVECDEYPCDELKDFRNDRAPHHSAVLKNLERIREIGREAWLEEEDRRWSCPECGRRFHWYEEECASCGVKLYNSVAEERELDI